MSVLEPRGGSEPGPLLCDYLDFYRAVVEAKLRALPEAALRESRLPSGWTPIELLSHLVHMERRWFVWGFSGDQVPDPWGDNLGARADERWHVDPAVSLDELLHRLHAGGRRTRRIIEGTDLAATAPPGPRFEGDQTASLAWTCFHVLQEYARHAGHLDIAAELAGGPTGEE